MRIHASSGTTGKPTVVGYTQNDIDNWANIVARSLRAAGGSAKDKIHVAYGYGLFTGGLGAHYGAERLGATVIPMSGGQTEKQAQLIRDFQPDMIMVTPSYCLNLIEELERQMGGDAAAVHCGSASLALSRGRWRCARKSRAGWGSPPWIFTVCRKSWDRA
ncbi:phenylacetate-coenzyme A ligase [Klebsiella pneumoniae]|nr:phenylacetate-coenzyme A ligase [Klebsiella pneumoniae]